MDDARVAKWLRSVELTPGSSRQGAIVKAADAFAQGADGQAVAAMVKLAFKLDSDGGFTSLSELISQSDTTFAGSADDLESQLAAGVLIAEVLDSNSAVSVCAGHCVLSAEWAEHTPALPELPDLARQSLARQSEAQRTRPEFPQPKQGPADVADFPDDGGPVTHAEGQPLVAAISTLSAQAATQAQQLSALRASQRAAEEELNILWWAFSGHSEQDTKPWSDIEPDGRAAVLAGLEFNWNLVFDTEPRRSTQILRRVLGSRSAEEVSLDLAVQDATADELRLPETIPNHVLLPVLVSLRECAQLQGKAGWIDSVERWGINPKRTVTCLDLAAQTLRELLLAEHLS